MQEITDEFRSFQILLKDRFYIKVEDITLNDSLLFPEFFTTNLDYSQYVESSFKQQLQLTDEINSYIPQNEELSSLYMLRDLQKVLTGAKPIILFYHSPMDLLIKSINYSSTHNNTDFLESILAFKSVRVAAIILKALYWLQVYFEAMHEYQEHGDDIQFQVFGISRSIQTLAGDFDYETFIDTQISYFSKKADWVQKLALFYMKSLETFQLISGDNLKQLRQAIGIISNQDLQYLAEYNKLEFFEKDLECYKSQNFGQQFAITFLIINDGQLSTYHEEIELSDLATIMTENKRQLSLLVDNIPQILNDSLFSYVNQSLFSFQFQNKLIDQGQINLWNSNLSLHYSKCQTQNIIISNNLHQFQSPALYRIAVLTLFYCQKQFVQQQVKNQLLSLYINCIGKSQIQFAGKEQMMFQTFCDLLTNNIVELILQAVCAHSGRMDRIFRSFMKTKQQLIDFINSSKVSAKLSTYLHQFIDFIYLEFGAIPFVQSLQFCQLSHPDQINSLFMVLHELSVQSYQSLVSIVCLEEQYIQFVKNDNFRYFIKFIGHRTLYYQRNTQKDIQIDENAFCSMFKTIRLCTEFKFESSSVNVQQLSDYDIDQLTQSPVSPGLFQPFSKQARLKLKLLCQFYGK